MNDFHSNNELIYKKRLTGSQISSAVNAFPVVVISGARQVGKSTFLQNEFQDFKYVSLDDFSTLKQAKTDPSSLWMDTERIIIDEAQKAPEIFTAVKLAVDKTKRKMRFLISGSSNILLMKGISETLAGRAVYFEMLPMTYGEMEDRPETLKNFSNLWRTDCKITETKVVPVDPLTFMLKGYMPPLMYLKNMKEILLWWED
jgi:predicted AAA+ superfamily ATPase